jgi:DNA-binding NtrC family response regulator
VEKFKAERKPGNPKLEKRFSFEETLIGQSECLKNIFRIMEKAAKTNINVSISGETGTGKELVARAIHDQSEFKKKPFVAVNMAAIPRELIESELFGYEKGSFTGATGRKIGKFEEANGGTLFLDEIGELDISVQSKLLRFLQEREIERIGGTEKIKLQVRLMIATHKNLNDEVKLGKFREDLYYRVIGLPIILPPLRERGQDILILAQHFLEEFSFQNKLGKLLIHEEARRKLLDYPYPGNVRELKAIMDLAAVMCENSVILASDIRFHPPKTGFQFIMEQKSLKEYTFDIIRYYLKKNNNDVMATAKILDIGKSTIYKLIQTEMVS